MTRRSRTVRAAGGALALATAIALVSSGLGGCSSRSGDVAAGAIRIGYVASEDCLPLWVAERDGLAKDAGLGMKLSDFATAEERDAALAGGEVDAVVGDVVSAAKMRLAGTPVRIATVMLGAKPAEGRYGIAVRPKSGVTSLVQLAGKPVGTSKGTLEEYVLESLMMLDGLGPAEIETKTVKDAAARLDAVVAGEMDAAVLPEPYLTLAEKRGAKVVAQDTHDVNLSQSVLVVSERYLDTSDGAAATAKLREVLASAVTAIEADRGSFRSLLAKKIPAMEPVQSSYQVSPYPSPQMPTLDDVEMALDWMTRAGLQKGDLIYESLIWVPPPDATPAEP